MSRIRLNADGTRSLLSWSYFGPGDPDEVFRQDMARLVESNHQALTEWNKLTLEEQQQRIAEYEKIITCSSSSVDNSQAAMRVIANELRLASSCHRSYAA